MRLRLLIISNADVSEDVIPALSDCKVLYRNVNVEFCEIQASLRLGLGNLIGSSAE